VDKGLHPFLKETLNSALKDGSLDEEALLDAAATRIAKMGLAVPAIFFLESSKPLSFLGSQFLVFIEPFVKTFIDIKNYDKFCLMMEDRSNVEKLIQKIEQLEETLKEEERQKKQQKRQEKKAEKERKKHERSHSG
jgi:ABC-type Zn2+ transport system substrate-binding protein/surface adhesin